MCCGTQLYLQHGVKVQRESAAPAVCCVLSGECDCLLIGPRRNSRQTHKARSDLMEIYFPLSICSLAYHIIDWCTKSQSFVSNLQLGGGRGRLMQSHVMAELKTCWRGEEEGMEEDHEEGRTAEMQRLVWFSFSTVMIEPISVSCLATWPQRDLCLQRRSRFLLLVFLRRGLLLKPQSTVLTFSAAAENQHSCS